GSRHPSAAHGRGPGDHGGDERDHEHRHRGDGDGGHGQDDLSGTAGQRGPGTEKAHGGCADEEQHQAGLGGPFRERVGNRPPLPVPDVDVGAVVHPREPAQRGRGIDRRSSAAVTTASQKRSLAPPTAGPPNSVTPPGTVATGPRWHIPGGDAPEPRPEPPAPGPAGIPVGSGATTRPSNGSGSTRGPGGRRGARRTPSTVRSSP